jgi:hypothetical protein
LLDEALVVSGRSLTSAQRWEGALGRAADLSQLSVAGTVDKYVLN